MEIFMDITKTAFMLIGLYVMIYTCLKSPKDMFIVAIMFYVFASISYLAALGLSTF